MVKRDACFSSHDAAQLIGRLVDAVFTPSRLTSVELAGLLDSFNELLTCHPEIHRSGDRVFEFHQSLIVEHERRFVTELDAPGQIPGQLEFGDLVPVVCDMEVSY